MKATFLLLLAASRFVNLQVDTSAFLTDPLQNEHALLSALKALHDASFIPKTTSKSSNSVLRTDNEITYNVLWRFLQLRGFVNEKHELTSWGVALEAAISSLDSADKMEEYVFVAIEMLRMGLVNGKDMTNIPGGAEHGSGKQDLGRRI